jgi:hypothetical protein
VRDLGVVEALLANQVAGREAGVDVAESLVDLALEVALLVVVQQDRGLGACVGGLEVRGQRLDVEDDRRQRRRGSGRARAPAPIRSARSE